MTQAGASHGVGRDVGGRKECKEPDCVADSTLSGGGVSVTGGGARDLGRTGGVLSRKDRLQVFGIDCTGPFGDGILFKGGEWAPGGEYTQRLRVKNVSPKLKKLKYRLPTTKYFSLAYPEVITLSPGTVQEVDVVFRPTSSEVYDDVILFKVLDGPNAGGFNVPVRALLPTLQVVLPIGLDFGYCQADDVSERVIFVRNTGEVAAPFLWEVPPPFKMSPPEGVVQVGESKPVTCSIRPSAASVFVSQAVLRVGQGVNAIKPKPLLDMKVSAVGKYCYVVPSEDELDFGDQAVVAGGGGSGSENGSRPRKDFTLRNQSVVPAAFNIQRLEGDRDAVFSVYPSEGVIPPEDEVVITTTYSPVSTGTFSRDHYEIATTGGNKVTVGIQGRAVGCSVRLEKKEDPFARGCGVPDSMNFREVEVGFSTSRVVYLYNQSSAPCRFCFDVQGDSSVFRFSRTRGSIPSAGSEHPGEAQVTLTFVPTKPTNYYRRIFCLLENQQPLVLDAMGTAYVVPKGEVQEQRPAPLRHAHVQAFRNRENVGLGRCSPEEVSEVLKAEGLSDLFAKVGPEGTIPLRRCGVSRPLTRSGEATRVQTAVAAEFFVDSADPFLNGVYLDRTSVDFGFAAAGGGKTINLTNNSNTEVHVVWNLRSSAQGEEGGPGLQVIPLEADLPAGGSRSFRVEVSPTKRNCNFAEEAEAFVSPSNQMTFRTVKDATHQPPWCLPLLVLGHTFIGEQFLAKASLSTQHTGQRLCFPACHVGDSVYQTLRLSNQGNIPACFSFQPDPTGAFDIKPAVGLVPAGDFQLCLVRFTPPGLGERRHRLVCVLNNDPGSSQEADLLGQGAVPAIQVSGGGREGGDDRSLSQVDSFGSSLEGELERGKRAVTFMRPTCVGIVSSGSFQVSNSSRIPVIFAIDPPKASSGVFRVTPIAGLLLGNQTATLQVIFAPRETKEYHFRLPVKVRSLLGETPLLTDCRQLGEAAPAVIKPGAYVTVVGQGERGAVTFHPESLSYSVRLVNTSESKCLVLENCSECDVTYKLFYIANREPPARHSSKGGTAVGEAGGGGGGGGGESLGKRELRPVPKENGEAKGQSGHNTSHALFVDKPQGILPARSRTRTIATFRPISEGEYEFSFLCQVSLVNRTGDVSVNSPSHLHVEKEMAEQGHKARASAARLEDTGVTPPVPVTNSAGNGVSEAGSDERGMMPLRCSVSGRASFPTVVFRDVRMTREGGEHVPGSSPRSLWAALSLSRINDMLSKPLSEEEVKFNQESSPDTAQLPRFDVPFVPSVMGCGPVVITLQVCNPGLLPTSVTVNLPNAKPVEMETWANQGEPTAEELRQNEIIDRLKAFTITPDPGTVIEVSAGERKTLRIAYSADSLLYEGVHDLPVLVSIKEGRHFWLDLKGTTVPRQSPMLYVPTGLHKQYVLKPVAVGTPLAEAPMQTTELLNVGEAVVSYRVEGHGIRRANNAQGHGIPVFRLENKEGTIPGGGGSAFLRWRFLPVEAKEYVLRVTVRTTQNENEKHEGHTSTDIGEQFPQEQSLDITLKGVGYDPRTRDPHSENLPAVDLGLTHPARQLEVPAGQPCVLGAERLRLGRIPQGAVFSRVISIRNCHSTAVQYSWDPYETGLENPLLSSGVVSIRPLRGSLEADQSTLLHLTISAGCGPRFLGQQPMACAVRLVPPTTASRSRKPKSKLQSRMEEERQARNRLAEPRVPLVSRPTAARTQHMADLAAVLSTRSNSGDNLRVLVPRYPVSTINPPVPRALANALEVGIRADGMRDGRGNIASGGSKSGGNGGGAEGVRTGGLGLTNSLANSGEQSDWYSLGEDTTGTLQGVQGGACLLRLEVEGEVVCTETYHSLFDGRREIHGRVESVTDSHAEKLASHNGSSRGRMDAFLVPCPSKYVADWSAFGAGGGNGGADLKSGHHDAMHDAMGSNQSSVTTVTSEKSQKTQQVLLKHASQDPLVGGVASRVLKRLMEDVVAAHEVRECLQTLPPKARVPTFSEIQNVLPLPDRVAAALAPHLQAYLARSAAPAQHPEADTNALRDGGIHNHFDIISHEPGVNRNTPLSKESLAAALRATGGVVETCPKKEEFAGGAATAEVLSGFLDAIEALPEHGASIADLISTLNNSTIASVEKWLERENHCPPISRPTSHPTGSRPDLSASATVSTASNAKADEGLRGSPLPSGPEAAAHPCLENKKATAVQPQVGHQQSIQANPAIQATSADKAGGRRLRELLASKACENQKTQRTVAAALEGTFFNIMQEALHGEFSLRKRPKRFAIKKASSGRTLCGKAAKGGVGSEMVSGEEATPSQGRMPPEIGVTLKDDPVTENARGSADKDLAACPPVPSY